jgi:uncharacterized alpha/beta hydrolase family protein
MRLAKTLKIGYESKEKQEKKMERRGYTRDNELSNGDHQAYINKNNGKLLFNVTGSHNLKDAITDGYLAFGGLKNTSRYKTADAALKKAKEKYNPTNVSVVGHSLGGSIAGLISSKSDHKALHLVVEYVVMKMDLEHPVMLSQYLIAIANV